MCIAHLNHIFFSLLIRIGQHNHKAVQTRVKINQHCICQISIADWRALTCNAFCERHATTARRNHLLTLMYCILENTYLSCRSEVSALSAGAQCTIAHTHNILKPHATTMYANFFEKKIISLFCTIMRNGFTILCTLECNRIRRSKQKAKEISVFFSAVFLGRVGGGGVQAKIEPTAHEYTRPHRKWFHLRCINLYL